MSEHFSRFMTTAHRPHREGFSLIEIMVAMAILSIIVLIVANIFQQTGLAWSLGLKRADAQSVTRALIGSIGRDMGCIVDPANFVIYPSNEQDSQREKAYGTGSLDKSKGRVDGGLDFWILRNPMEATDSLTGADIPARELIRVEYSGNVTRKETPYSANGKPSLGNGTTTNYNLGNGSVSFKALSFTEDAKTYTSFYADGSGSPDAVEITVRPATALTVNDYEIAVGSCGPDGQWDTEDDIRTWVKGEDK